MIIDPKDDIQPLTAFKQNASGLLRQMQRTGRPIVLTRNGKAAAVAMDVESYRELIAEIDRLETIEGVRRGLEDVEAGRTRPFAEVRAELLRKHGLSDTDK